MCVCVCVSMCVSLYMRDGCDVLYCAERNLVSKLHCIAKLSVHGKFCGYYRSNFESGYSIPSWAFSHTQPEIDWSTWNSFPAQREKATAAAIVPILILIY